MKVAPGWPARVSAAAVALAALLGIGLFAWREIARPTSLPRESQLLYRLPPQADALTQIPRCPKQGEMAIDLEQPRGIACAPDGAIYVCGDRAVVALEASGATRARYALEEEPRCLAAGADGRIYVGMRDHVEVLDPRSGRTVPWPHLGPQAIVTSVAAGPGGVYVADAGNHAVLRFDSGGRLAGRVADRFLVPSPYFDVAACPDGTVWAVDPGRHRVQRYTSEGKSLGGWGRSSVDLEGFGGCCNPTDIALLSDGSLATSEKGILRVKVYSPAGKLAAIVALPADFRQSEARLDLAVSPEGTILVLLPEERVVRLYGGKR